MKSRENFRDRIVKCFFSISGDFDEYKRQEANRIGTNAMLLCLLILLLPPVVAAFWIDTAPANALIGLLLFDLCCVNFIVFPYILVASRRAHLTDHEVNVHDLPAARRHDLKCALGYGLYAGVFLYLEQAIINSIFDGTNFIRELLAITNIKTGVLSGLTTGILMEVVFLIRLKKQQ
ncbi:DUF3278 domain-containing protein [Levilactobacillus enshiensis]|uniref:DUF3278 domain-containing protein n=1 Tax=Levilactobacillus enshiensis TaxID=2590213 RepID=UPI001179F374|nr:DUF3278 domain-containing protein [Levilactobacillus enshiensis]